MNKRNLMVSLMMIGGLFAQSITGIVTDADVKPLNGANVVVEGTDLGAVTSETGFYSINLIDAILFLNIRVTVGNIIKQFKPLSILV